MVDKHLVTSETYVHIKEVEGGNLQKLEEGGSSTSTVIKQIEVVEIIADFNSTRSIATKHFFIKASSLNPAATEEVGGPDPDVAEPESITQFLQLSTVTISCC